MTIRIASSLHRNRYGILYFRMAVPEDLRHRFTSKEIYRSLRTASITEAAETAQTLAIVLRQAFREIRQQHMSDQKNTPAAPPISLDDLVKHAQQKIRLQLRIEELDQALDAVVEARLADKKQHNEILAVVTRAAVKEPKKPSILFSQLVKDYERDRLAEGAWTTTTRNENLAIYKLFINIIGDLPIHDIGKDQMLTYVETLKQLPANMNKLPEYRGKPISEIIALKPPPMTNRTINKYLERISSLFKYAIKEPDYDLRYNPFSGRSLDESKAKKRGSFTTDELVRLFSAPEHAQRKYDSGYSYWLPILGLLTGARLNELCQLHLSDFEVIGGIHCINIQDEQPGQKVKNKNARRYIPIHDKLIELGLIRYVEQLRAQGHERLFPMLRYYEKGGYGKKPSEWFTAFRQRCGIVEKHTKVFHSFRHTFISTLLSDDVPASAIAPIVGHEGDLITDQVYWNEKAPAKRKPTVEKFQPPPEVWALIPKIEEVTILKA